MNLTSRRVLHLASLGATLVALAIAGLTLAACGFLLEEASTRLLLYGALLSVYLGEMALVVKVLGVNADAVSRHVAASIAEDDLEVGGGPSSGPAPGELRFRKLGLVGAGVSVVGFLVLLAIRLQGLVAATPGGAGPSKAECWGLMFLVAAALATMHLLLASLARCLRRGAVRGVSDIATVLTGAPSLPPMARPEGAPARPGGD